MRLLTTLLTVSLLVLPCSGARSQPEGESSDSSGEQSTERETGDAPEYTTHARAGIIAGVVLDVLGFTGVIVGSYVALELDSEAVLWPTIYASGGSWVLGSIILSGAYTDRHRAHRDAGLEPRPNPGVLSWLFTVASAAAFGGSLGAFARYASADEDDWSGRNENMLGSVFLLGLSAAAEGINLGVFRTLWRKELRRVASRDNARMMLVPTVVGSQISGSRVPIAGVALVGTF